MANEPLYRLGDLQLRILQVLWDQEAGSVADVHRAVGEGLAYTTIATMLRKMEDRGLVAHREEGRKFIYRAEVEQQQVTHGIAERLVDRLFHGSLAGAVSHLLETRGVDGAELDQLEALIRDHRQR